ncbi:transposase [Planktothrix serta]|uniref:transposase n=1 Tax=Planktothrix serta TaxID=1678310 RepID=UPI0038B393A1
MNDRDFNPRDSKSTEKSKRIVAKVHEKIANSRQDFLHKLSRKLVNESVETCHGASVSFR